MIVKYTQIKVTLACWAVPSCCCLKHCQSAVLGLPVCLSIRAVLKEPPADLDHGRCNDCFMQLLFHACMCFLGLHLFASLPGLQHNPAFVPCLDSRLWRFHATGSFCQLRPLYKTKKRQTGADSSEPRRPSQQQHLPAGRSPGRPAACKGSVASPWRRPPADTRPVLAGRAPRRRAASAARWLCSRIAETTQHRAYTHSWGGILRDSLRFSTDTQTYKSNLGSVLRRRMTAWTTHLASVMDAAPTRLGPFASLRLRALLGITWTLPNLAHYGQLWRGVGGVNGIRLPQKTAEERGEGKRCDSAGCQSAAGLNELTVNPSKRHHRTLRWHDTKGWFIAQAQRLISVHFSWYIRRMFRAKGVKHSHRARIRLTNVFFQGHKMILWSLELKFLRKLLFNYWLHVANSAYSFANNLWIQRLSKCTQPQPLRSYFVFPPTYLPTCSIMSIVSHFPEMSLSKKRKVQTESRVTQEHNYCKNKEKNGKLLLLHVITVLPIQHADFPLLAGDWNEIDASVLGRR